ncbi:hypothetical protein ACSNOK_17840 [Streptomyces sp. URMC 126]|uniref:hypothetical protein n=1 Tax=Streptomyces sp. URMC 126 TaxID=3423401 RepID=UPI003F1D8844
MRDGDLPVRPPLVLDAREPDATAVLHRLRACGMPVPTRVRGSLQPAVSDAPSSGRETRLLSAALVGAGARELWRPVTGRHAPVRAGAAAGGDARTPVRPYPRTPTGRRPC